MLTPMSIRGIQLTSILIFIHLPRTAKIVTRQTTNNAYSEALRLTATQGRFYSQDQVEIIFEPNSLVGPL